MTTKTTMTADDLATRLEGIEDRVRRACARRGRERSSVTLVGASKRQPIERLRSAFDAGLRDFGENIVQEGVAKQGDLPTGITWHFFGPLQSNKIKLAARHFAIFHAVDRLKVARLLDREAAALGCRLRGFVQVNLGAEESKHGFAAEDLAEAVSPLSELENLEVVGLMAIPPYEKELEQARQWFRDLRVLRDRLGERPEWSGWPGWLSMGMSHDFETAIEEGATHVRVGSALFGARDS